MDLDQMRTQVRTTVRDDTGLFITTEDIDVWLNEAQRDLASRLRALQKSTTGTVAANSMIPFPADLLMAHSLFVGTEKAGFVNDDVFQSWTDAAADPGVVLYRIFGTNIVLYPDQTGNAYTLEYEYEPADLTAPSDVSPLPLSLHVKMVQYARGQAALKDQNSEAATYITLYEEGLPSVSRGGARRVATPLNMGFQMGPFDLDSDARHL